MGIVRDGELNNGLIYTSHNLSSASATRFLAIMQQSINK